MRKNLLSSMSAVILLASTFTAPKAYGMETAMAEPGSPEAKAEPTQELVPPQQIEMYLDGFHIYKKQMNLPTEKQTQVRVAHYCTHYSPELFECVVYSGNSKNSRLIGIEYVVTKEAYDALPAAEKKYWHPHDGEVDSGLLRMPGLSEEKEKATLNFLKTTYGKTWNLWQPEDKLPVGTPELMWAISPDQIKAETKKAVEARAADYHY